MRGKRKQLWAALLITAMVGQLVSGGYAADKEQIERATAEAAESSGVSTVGSTETAESSGVSTVGSTETAAAASAVERMERSPETLFSLETEAVPETIGAKEIESTEVVSAAGNAETETPSAENTEAESESAETEALAVEAAETASETLPEAAETVMPDETMEAITRIEALETESLSEAETQTEETELLSEAETHAEETELLSEAETQTEETEELLPETEEREWYAEPQTYTYADAQITVEVTVPEGVKLPYGAELSVAPILEGSVEYKAAVAAIESVNEGRSFVEHILYDISFIWDGQIVEPQGGDVIVNMAFAKPALQIENAPAEILEDEVVVSHILKDKTVEDVTQKVQTTVDGAVERVEFVTGSFSVYGLSREVTYNGVFNNLGEATVILDDGTTIKVEGNWAYFPEKSKVRITPLPMNFPYRAAHGELKNGVGYQVVITNANGDILAPAGSSYDVTITKEKGFGFKASGQGVKGIRSNASFVLELDPNAKYTETECKVTGIIPGADSKVLVGPWDYSSDTFISTGGSYSLGYILNKYNAFIRENYSGTHVVGPIVVGGDAAVSLGGSTTEASYPHNVPDYVGTYSHSSGTVTTLSDIPVYFSKAAEGRAYSLVGAAGEYDDYYFTSWFVDFDAAMSSLQAEAAGFDGEPVEAGSGIVELAMGGKYAFTAAQLSGIASLDLKGTLGDGRDTFLIVKDAAPIKIPNILVNGSELQSIEAGMTSGIVFLFPYATAVSGGSGGSVSGHIVAPAADVQLTGGNFNGCVIAQSLSTSAEGHMWNYNGSALLPSSAGLQASKTVDGKIPGNAESGMFTFVLEEFVNGGWQKKQSVSNQGGSVKFKEIAYANADTYWYRIRETGQVEGYEMDSTQYVVKVKTTIKGGRVEKEITYYKVKSEAELINGGMVNEAALAELTLPKKGSSADVVRFDNRSVAPVPETVSRTVTKIWKDGNDQDNVRPEKIEVQLKADGMNSGDAVELNIDNSWSYTWNELPKYKEGTEVEIVYTVEEIGTANGYATQYSQDTFTITNTKTTEISGTKTWAGVPATVTKPTVKIELLQNGTKIDEQDLIDNAYSFMNLEKYDNDGREYEYTVREAMTGANAGRFISRQDENGNFTNHYLTFTVNKVALGSGEELDGAKLVVIDKEANSEVASWISVKGQTHDFGDVLTPGKNYILREKVAPLGYNYATDIEFHIDEDGTVVSAVLPTTDDEGNEIYLVKDAITELTILKVDREGNGVAGAELVIRDANGNVIIDEKGAPKYAWTTDGKPYVLKGIPAGSYILSEEAAPAGYESAKDVPFTVTNEKDAVNKVTMVDERSTGKETEGKPETEPGEETEGKPETEPGKETEGKPETEPGKETEGKPETEPGKETEGKPETEPGKETEGKPETEPGKETEGKPETEPETETETEAETKTEIETETETKNETETEAETKTETETETRPETETETEIETATEAESKAETETETEIEIEIETETGRGSLTVTKTLKLAGMNLAITAPDATFYVALFADEARTERVSAVKPLDFKNQSVSEIVFENLEAGTYYVGETDADGNLLEIGFVGTVGYEPVYSGGYVVKLERDTSVGQITFDNLFYDLPHGFLYEYFLNITKEVAKGGKPYETDKVFYAGVFYDAAFTELYELVTLPMNGSSSTTIEIPLPVGADPKETVTFYVTEVDESGIPLSDGRSLAFRISADHTEIKVSGYNPLAEVTIINDYFEEEIETEIQTELESETETDAKKGVMTGDVTDYMTYIWLLGISAGTLLLGEWKRRRNQR